MASKKTTSVLLWILSFLFMATIAVYQRLTGPTYPKKARLEMSGSIVKGKLLTSSDSDGEALITLTAPDTAVTATYEYKRYKSHDEWTRLPMIRQGDDLVAALPHQPPAGKVMYRITVEKGAQSQALSQEPTVLRYKGKVPDFFLWPHILLMFLAMVFSTRTGLEALFKGGKTYSMAIWTSLFFLAGGIILGPIVQKYAFGAYWTGWPWGHDLTDNKTAVAMIMWIIAVVRLRKQPKNRSWAIAAALVLLAIYLIPHSVLGSEIDYTNN